MIGPSRPTCRREARMKRPTRRRRRRGGPRRRCGVARRRRRRGARRGGRAPARRGRPRPSSARDLVDRENLSGTLGYADTGTLVGRRGRHPHRPARARAPWSRAATRSTDVDDEPAAFLFYGTLPAWRDFAPGMSDGDDVRQLERNLRALGYDPGDVDDDWDWETTAAVEHFQRDRGPRRRRHAVARRGRLPRRRDAHRRGQGRGRRAGRARAPQARRSPRPIATSTVDLDARRQSLAREGDRVTVDLPSGRTRRGRITDVGKVATKAGEEATRRSTSRSPVAGTRRRTSTRRRSTSASPSSAAAACWRSRSRRCWPARAAATRSSSPTARHGAASRPGSTPTTWSRSRATACARARRW